MQFSDQAQWVETTPWPKRIIVFIILTIIDLGFNASAGAAAASAGAHRAGLSDSSLPLSSIVALGALAGTMKSGVLAIPVAGRRFGGLNFMMSVMLIMLFNPFGICTLITALISQRVLDGNVPKELLIAGLVTALPLFPEMVYPEAVGGSRIATVTLVGWDALAGYTFARMAHNQGYEVCDFNVAAVAGAVYGTLSMVKGLIVNLLGSTRFEISSNGMGQHGHVSSLLGSWEVYDPLPPPGAFSAFDMGMP